MVAYVAWLVSSGVAAFILFFIWLPALRQAYTMVGLLLRWQDAVWAYAAFSNLVAFTFALGWLILTVLAEAWYREAVRRGLLWRRIARVALMGTIAVGLGYGVLWLT